MKEALNAAYTRGIAVSSSAMLTPFAETTLMVVDHYRPKVTAWYAEPHPRDLSPDGMYIIHPDGARELAEPYPVGTLLFYADDTSMSINPATTITE